MKLADASGRLGEEAEVLRKDASGLVRKLGRTLDRKLDRGDRMRSGTGGKLIPDGVLVPLDARDSKEGFLLLESGHSDGGCDLCGLFILKKKKMLYWRFLHVVKSVAKAYVSA